MTTIKRRNYFLRYFAVFCVPVLLLGSLIWANNILYIYRETAAFRNTALSQMVESMDMLVDQTQAVADKANSNDDIVCARRGVGEDYERVSQWLRLYEDLFIDEITLAYYILGDTSITTRDGAMPYGDFESRYSDNINFSLAGYFKTLNQSGRFATSNLNWKNGAFFALSYTHPVTDQQARHVGTLCFLVPRSVLLSMFARYFPEGSAQLHILDAANKPVFLSNNNQAMVQALAKAGGLGLIDEGENGIVLRSVSRRGRFSYYVAMPRGDFYASSASSMSFLFILQAVLILFSAGVASLLARSHYANLQKMRGQNLRLEDELDAQGDIIRMLVLKKLIDGSRKEQAEIDYNLNCANIQFYHPNFFVLVADYSNAKDEDAESIAFSRLFEGKNSSDVYHQVVSLPEVKRTAVVINTAYDQKTLAIVVAGLLSASVIKTPAGFSACQQSCLRLNIAYIEAAVAVSERLSPAGGQLYLFTDMGDASCNSQLPMLEHTIIQESIRNGSKELLTSSVDTLFSKILVPSHHQQIVRLACFDVINLCVRLFTIFEIPLNARTIAELSGFESPAELNSAVKNLLFDLSDAVQEKLNSTMASTKYNLMGFVQEHFRDSNLSLGLLAEEFGLSQSYISKLFKDETGQNFISYVKQLRISYVKKQLMATDLQVKDIILDTGYVDVANFARTFKQEVGLTPLQYRYNIRQNG